MKIKYFLTSILLSLVFASCSTYKFNKIKTTNYKFCIWTVVDKVETDSGCIYYWNQGQNNFVDDCYKYYVGDTIKHQEIKNDTKKIRRIR